MIRSKSKHFFSEGSSGRYLVAKYVSGDLLNIKFFQHVKACSGHRLKILLSTTQKLYL